MENVKLIGAKNIRDLGGILNKEGLSISNKKILRGDNLSKLTPEDIKILVDEYNLHTIIDLRTDEEIAEAEDVKISNVKYIHIPLFTGQVVGITHKRKTDLTTNAIPNLNTLYKYMVSNEYSILQLKRVLYEIMNENNYSILFHCTEGKDRTGIVAMLILYMLDVDMKVIMEDYLFTNNTNQKKAESYFNMVLEKTNNEEFANQIRNIFLAKESYLESALESILEECGNLDNFMKERLDIESSARERFKRNVLINSKS